MICTEFSLLEIEFKITPDGVSEVIKFRYSDFWVEAVVLVKISICFWKVLNFFSVSANEVMITFFWEIVSLRSELVASSQNLERKAAMTISSVTMTIILNEERAHFKILPKEDLSNSFCGRRFITT